MGVTSSGWEERPCVPRVRKLCAEGGWALGRALPRAATARRSVQLSTRALSIPQASACSELPSGGCSAHGEGARRQHLLILSSESYHGDGRHRPHVALSHVPAEGRGVSAAPQGLSLAFRKAQRPRTTHHRGGKTSAHLPSPPPAAVGHGASDHQHREHCGRDVVADEHQTRGPQRAQTTLFFPPRRNLGAASSPTSTAAQTSHSPSEGSEAEK